MVRKSRTRRWGPFSIYGLNLNLCVSPFNILAICWKDAKMLLKGNDLSLQVGGIVCNGVVRWLEKRPPWQGTGRQHLPLSQLDQSSDNTVAHHTVHLTLHTDTLQCDMNCMRLILLTRFIGLYIDMLIVSHFKHWQGPFNRFGISCSCT